MVLVSRTAMVVWPLLCLAGCASVAGLDSITEQSCAPNCGTDGAALDATSDTDAQGGDATQMLDGAATGDTAAADGPASDDSSMSADSPGRDARTDAKSDAPGGDSGDGGCSIQHYYNLQMMSTSGFTDCLPQGTFSLQLAKDACAAYAGGAAQCDAMHTFTCSFADGGLAGDMVCADGPAAPDCSCWGYDGVIQGLMHIGTGPGSMPKNCKCPLTSDPMWD